MGTGKAPLQIALQLGSVEPGQRAQIEMATPREGQAVPQGNADALDPTAVGNWTEERMLELATSLAAMRTIRHQPQGLRQRTCAILKKLLQHHTNCPMGQEA